MASDVQSTSSSTAAVAEPAAVAEGPEADAPGRDERALAAGAKPPAKLDDKRHKKSKNNNDDDDIEYEVEFATPFGKIEFEFEPLSKKQKKDEQRKARAERDAAKAVARAAKLAEQGATQSGRGHGLLIALVIFAVVASIVALAIWLFARPGDDDVIPAEFRADDAPAPEPQGFVGKMRGRAREAVSAGRKASREAQDEQLRKFEEMTGR